MPEETDNNDALPESAGTAESSDPSPTDPEWTTGQEATGNLNVQIAEGQANNANTNEYVKAGVSALLQTLRNQLGSIANQAGIKDIGAPDTAREAQALQTDLDIERRVRQGIWTPVEGILRAAEQKIAATKKIRVIDNKLANIDTQLAQERTRLEEIETTLRDLQNRKDADTRQTEELQKQHDALLTQITSTTTEKNTAQGERDEIARSIDQMDTALRAAVDEFLNGLTALGIDAPVLQKLKKYATDLLQGASLSPTDGQGEGVKGEDLKNVLESQLASVVFEAVQELVGRIRTEKSTKDGRRASLDGSIEGLTGTITTLNQRATDLQARIQEIGGSTQQAEQAEQAVNEEKGAVTNSIATLDGQETRLQDEKRERASAENLRNTATTLHGLVGYHLTEKQTGELRNSIENRNADGIVTLLQTAELTKKGNTVRLYIGSTPITLNAKNVTNEIVADALKALDDNGEAVVGHAEAFNGPAMFTYIRNNAKKGGKVVGEYVDGTSFALQVVEDGVPPKKLRKSNVYRLACIPPVKAE